MNGVGLLLAGHDVVHKVIGELPQLEMHLIVVFHVSIMWDPPAAGKVTAKAQLYAVRYLCRDSCYANDS
jgi:hypothetical protein